MSVLLTLVLVFILVVAWRTTLELLALWRGSSFVLARPAVKPDPSGAPASRHVPNAPAEPGIPVIVEPLSTPVSTPHGIYFLSGSNQLDPIDGTVIELSESTVACACGLVYRAASIQWIAEHLAGLCAGCGNALSAPSIQIGAASVVPKFTSRAQPSPRPC